MRAARKRELSTQTLYSSPLFFVYLIGVNILWSCGGGGGAKWLGLLLFHRFISVCICPGKRRVKKRGGKKFIRMSVEEDKQENGSPV